MASSGVELDRVLFCIFMLDVTIVNREKLVNILTQPNLFMVPSVAVMSIK
jgi:hypothetical protein